MSALTNALNAHTAWQASDPPNLRDYYGTGPRDFAAFQAALAAWHATGAALWANVEQAAAEEQGARPCPTCGHPAVPRDVEDAAGGRWTFWYHADDPEDERTYCAARGSFTRG